MVTKNNLIGLGMSPALGALLGTQMVVATAYGTSAGSANPINGGQYLTLCFTGTSSFVLPQVGGDGIGKGANIGDEYWVANLSGAAVQVYMANTAAGSAVTMYSKGVSLAGTVGVSVANGWPTIFKFASASTVVCFNSGASA